MDLEAEENKHAYNQWHGKRGSPEDPLSFPWYRSVFREIRDSNPRRILEVGCGQGEFALFLSEKFGTAAIIAVDFSEVAIAIAQDAASKSGKRINFICANAECLPFGDNEF